ncbi:uncharacterized protein SPPG_03813 [Spizellomyces punctatus DAOM BR117]|uniref:U2A'/phosphoprotein 32 family A C-terminal domain-containing protein n=1 Tax=Spizellomyces punctatus (strain DAOM BR117) TaxID=645134 RepID=A0A0L0HHX5_SPIPD|nr:uncharacterized protein SPPG_03813 [Spizellomyces punctatus DAOM BR117]KND00692.1 hypothetical protein SPPG_03813 [Spizellomyces punctatus DAOM BR117]|eukprot:XP_016608731.1 hypothetical protein SPPG_03813 [Spizellomyces punctatus DAOM BR117]
MKLTPAILASRHPGSALSDLVNANCSDLGISHIEDISAAVNLHKLDLSKNAIKKADALSGIKYNKEITWLNLSGNSLESMEGVEHLQRLLVLNMSHNEVNRISHHVANCKLLKALILNHNKIARLEYLANLTQLNTLVVSHNKLTNLDGLGSLPNLTKLSAAHNEIRTFPDLRMVPSLKELRLTDNKILSIPDHIRFLPALEILDMGNNLMRSIADVASLASLHAIINLNLKGNPLVEKEKGVSEAASGKYRKTLLTLCPTLRVLDTERFDEKFLERKTKRKAFMEKRQRKLEREKANEKEEDGTGPRAELPQRTRSKNIGDTHIPASRPERQEGQTMLENNVKRKREDHDVKHQKEERPTSGKVNSAKRARHSEATNDQLHGGAANGMGSSGKSKGSKPRDRLGNHTLSASDRRKEKVAPTHNEQVNEVDPFFLVEEAESAVSSKASSKNPRRGTGGKTDGKSTSKPILNGATAPKKVSAATKEPAHKSQHPPAKKSSSTQPPYKTTTVERISSESSSEKVAPSAAPTAASAALFDAATPFTPPAPVVESTNARSGVIAVVEVKGRKPKGILEPSAAVEHSRTGDKVESAGLLVGGWD